MTFLKAVAVALTLATSAFAWNPLSERRLQFHHG